MTGLLRKVCTSFVMLPLLVGTAYAVPINILSNGSFEDGGGSLTGWDTSGSFLRFPVSVIVTDGVTGSAFGEAVPADNAVSLSPDAAGLHGAYFVDDLANQMLTQLVFLTAGSYEVGFDAYAPSNGFNNRFDATFTGAIAEVSLADYRVKETTPREWVNYSGIADILFDGFYSVAFGYQSFGVPAADVVIDKAYIIASDETGGIPIPPPSTIPEPATLALLSLGLAGLGFTRRKIRT